MPMYLVRTRATVNRRYWVTADNEKQAIEKSTTMSPATEDEDGCEETVAVETLES